MGLVNNISLDSQVLVNEGGGIGCIGQDAPNLRCRKNHNLRPFLLHESAGRGLIGEIKFGTGSGNDIAPLAPQLPQDRRSDHPTMACHIIARHASGSSRHRHGQAVAL